MPENGTSCGYGGGSREQAKSGSLSAAMAKALAACAEPINEEPPASIAGSEQQSRLVEQGAKLLKASAKARSWPSQSEEHKGIGLDTSMFIPKHLREKMLLQEEPRPAEAGKFDEPSPEATAGTPEQQSLAETKRRRAICAFQAKVAAKTREDLVIQWREISRPRGQGAVAAQPAGARMHFEPLFAEWLAERGIADSLERQDDDRGWMVFRYTRNPVVHEGPHATWEQAFHGTWWYSVWSVLESGVLLESDDKDKGHDFWEPGVYCTPNRSTARWYARPHNLFGDDVYHRIIFELRADTSRRRRCRQRGGVQWVFPTDAVSLQAVWVQVNAPPSNGEERVNEWDPALEALPPGCSAPPPTVSTRVGPWPEIADEKWNDDEDDVPPYLTGANPQRYKPIARDEPKLPPAQSYDEFSAVLPNTMQVIVPPAIRAGGGYGRLLRNGAHLGQRFAPSTFLSAEEEKAETEQTAAPEHEWCRRPCDSHRAADFQGKFVSSWSARPKPSSAISGTQLDGYIPKRRKIASVGDATIVKPQGKGLNCDSQAGSPLLDAEDVCSEPVRVVKDIPVDDPREEQEERELLVSSVWNLLA